MVYVLTLRQDGLTIRAIAARLNAESVQTPTGKPRWHPSNVGRLLTTRFAQEVREEMMRTH
ncbi:recombinase family protein [Actinomadura bangladeshensis]